MLSSMQKDVLTEILNVQLGAAASLLSEMVDQKVILSVPELEIKRGAQLNSDSIKTDRLIESNQFVLTSVTFGKEFNGKALVVFPQNNASLLVKACLGKDQEFEDNQNLSYEDADVIKEICNIILNSLVGEFGNMLEIKLEYTSIDLGFSIDAIDNKDLIPPYSEVLVLYTSFFLTKSQVRGVILVALSADSFDMLVKKVDRILRDLNA